MYQSEEVEMLHYRKDFVEYLRNMITKGGVSQLNIGSRGGSGGHKYKRKKLRLDESVEQIANNI